MIQYDPLSTVLYTVGVAIEHEDDPKVRLQLEDFEYKLTKKIREIRESKVLEILER